MRTSSATVGVYDGTSARCMQSGSPARVSRHFRQRKGQEQRATWLELFFDLVFVFAVTQLSHYVVAHYTWLGALEALLLLLVVWWAWIYTTWMANWFDPDSVPVRLVLIVVMLLGLLMSAAIPTAFGDNGLLFACSYVALQVARNVFNVVVAEPGSQWQQSFSRILAWSLLVAPLWILGGLLEHDARLAVWLLALGVDYLGPAARYWTPRLGATQTTDWSIEGAHFAERFQLFIIIALGESIVVTGATASEAGLGLPEVTALSVAFVTSAALWWLYFDRVAVHAQGRLARSSERERLGRDAYTYLHIPIVAGIILSAVGDEVMIDHPGDAARTGGCSGDRGRPGPVPARPPGVPLPHDRLGQHGESDRDRRAGRSNRPRSARLHARARLRGSSAALCARRLGDKKARHGGRAAREPGLGRRERVASAVEEATHGILRLVRHHGQRQPVARVADRLVPGEVAPHVQLLLRIAGGLRQLARQALHPGVDHVIELVGRHRPVDEAPLRRLLCGYLVAEQDDLARAPVADHQLEPLRGAPGRDTAVLETDVADVGVVDDHREVAGHLQLVPAADRHAVDAGDGRLADLSQPVVHVLEGAEPLPVAGRVAQVVVAPGAQVGADAECAPRARDDDGADLVVP